HGPCGAGGRVQRRARRSPPPPRGGGGGGGGEVPGAELAALPPPYPSPASGGGKRMRLVLCPYSARQLVWCSRYHASETGSRLPHYPGINPAMRKHPEEAQRRALGD